MAGENKSSKRASRFQIKVSGLGPAAFGIDGVGHWAKIVVSVGRDSNSHHCAMCSAGLHGGAHVGLLRCLGAPFSTQCLYSHMTVTYHNRCIRGLLGYCAGKVRRSYGSWVCDIVLQAMVLGRSSAKVWVPKGDAFRFLQASIGQRRTAMNSVPWQAKSGELGSSR